MKNLYKDTVNNFYRGDATSHKSCKRSQIATNDDDLLHNLKVVPCYCYCCLILHFVIISLCPNHVETNLKAASSDKLDVVFLAAAKWYIYVWIQMKLFICLYVLLMCMYVHFLETKYQSINQWLYKNPWGYVIDMSKYHPTMLVYGAWISTQ